MGKMSSLVKHAMIFHIVATKWIFLFSMLHLSLATPPLSQLSVNPDTIAVSGFSSGGCFATQFHAAFSGTVAGMGSFSGCPYLSGSDIGFDVDGIVTATRDLAASGSIDPVDEMARDQVFIFQGHKDPIVPWSNAGLVHQFYSAFTQEQNIEEKSDLQATHGMPSDSYGCSCDTLCPYFYINNCHYNGAAAVIQKTLPGFVASSNQQLAGTLQTFDQEEFFDNNAGGHSMESYGYVYIPKRCENGDHECHLHVNFHGCGMGSNWIGDNYIRHSGFLPVADANDVIMLFPQIHPLNSAGNDNGCWDWWGYLGDTTGYAYATKDGLQMRGIAAMVERLSGMKP